MIHSSGSPRDTQLYLRLLAYVAPYRLLFLVAIIAMVVLAAADAAKAALLKPMLDGAFIEKDSELMVSVPLYLVGLFVISGITTFISSASLLWVANKVIMDLREQMFSKLLSFPSKYYDQYNSGSIISKFTYDVTQIKEASTYALTVLVKDTLVITGLLAWMFYLDWRMTLIILLCAPLILLIIFFIRRRLRNMSQKVQQTMADINHVLTESIHAQRIIKLFGGQKQEHEKFYKIINANRHYTMKFLNASISSGPAVQLIASIAMAVIIYYAAKQSELGMLSVGTFVSFFAALVMLLDALRRLVKVNEFIQRGLAACESVFSMLDEQIESDSGTEILEEINGVIDIEDLSFRYGGEAQILDGISLHINKGETIALVGASGSGKTTLAHLIPRFYQHSNGRILIDGKDTRDITLAALRRHIALVSQDTVLFNDSIRNNIAYGSLRDAKDEQIKQAALAAHAMEFIDKLPEGINTLLGERGIKLSGGQRQRISLARALLKNAPILILDEATSALDSDSERNIQLALEKIRHKHTCIIIAHRLSTIESADRIIVLEHGRVVESGSHNELIKNRGLYAHFYSSKDFFLE